MKKKFFLADRCREFDASRLHCFHEGQSSGLRDLKNFTHHLAEFISALSPREPVDPIPVDGQLNDGLYVSHARRQIVLDITLAQNKDSIE